jgi:deazaflavin-dependent oxidoreductase (nitroreductase family)
MPRLVARLNRVGLNRLVRPLAPYAPTLGVIVHRGRKSGREYRTPVNVFKHGSTYVIALTYGTETEWLKNVIAAGGGVLETRGRRFTVSEPRLFRDEQRSAIPWPFRPILRALGVYDFLELRPSSFAA